MWILYGRVMTTIALALILSILTAVYLMDAEDFEGHRYEIAHRCVIGLGAALMAGLLGGALVAVWTM